MLLVALVWLLASGAACQDDLAAWERMMEEPVDRDRWRDPNDMGLAGGTGDCSVVEADLATCTAQLAHCQAATNLTTKQQSESAKPDPCSEEILFRRAVRQLVTQLGLQPGDGAHLRLEVVLSSHQVSTLTRFLIPGTQVSPVDVDTILSSYIRTVEQVESSAWLLSARERLEEVRDPLFVLLCCAALVYLAVLVFRTFPPHRILLLLFLLSLAWHWTHLYKAAWASKKAQLERTGEIPAECRPGEMSWQQSVQSSFSSVFTSVDKCEEYHKVRGLLNNLLYLIHSQAILVDPIYEVNPLTALVDLATKLLLYPLSR